MRVVSRSRPQPGLASSAARIEPKLGRSRSDRSEGQTHSRRKEREQQGDALERWIDLARGPIAHADPQCSHEISIYPTRTSSQTAEITIQLRIDHDRLSPAVEGSRNEPRLLVNRRTQRCSERSPFSMSYGSAKLCCLHALFLLLPGFREKGDRASRVRVACSFPLCSSLSRVSSALSFAPGDHCSLCAAAASAPGSAPGAVSAAARRPRLDAAAYGRHALMQPPPSRSRSACPGRAATSKSSRGAAEAAQQRTADRWCEDDRAGLQHPPPHTAQPLHDALH